MAQIKTLEEAQEIGREFMDKDSVIVDSNGHVYLNKGEDVVKKEIGKKDKLFIVK